MSNSYFIRLKLSSGPLWIGHCYLCIDGHLIIHVQSLSKPIIFSDEKNCKIVVIDASKYLQDKPPEVI